MKQDLHTERVNRSVVEAEVHAGLARTRYLRAGTGPTIVLLHGSAETAEAWNAWIARLAVHFRVLAPDRIDDERIRSPRAADETAIEWLRDFLDGLGVETVAILARGDGVEVATRFAAAYPERVTEVLLVARDRVTEPAA